MFLFLNIYLITENLRELFFCFLNNIKHISFKYHPFFLIINLQDECAPYKSLKKYEYPYTRDERTSDDRFNDKLKYWINTLTEYYGDVTDEEEYDIFAYIPLKALLPYVEEWCSTVDSLR